MSTNQPGTVSIRACSCTRAERKILVSVTIANDTDRPCFVIPRMRRVQMNRDTGVLSVWFSARGRANADAPGVRREFTVPRTEAIPEHSEKTLTASLPEDMTRLVPHQNGTFHLEAPDLTQATEIEVHAAVGDTPLYLSPSERTRCARPHGGAGP